MEAKQKIDLLKEILVSGNIIMLNNGFTYLSMMVRDKIILVRHGGFSTPTLINSFSIKNPLAFRIVIRPKSNHYYEFDRISKIFSDEKIWKSDEFKIIYNSKEEFEIFPAYKHTFDDDTKTLRVGCAEFPYKNILELNDELKSTYSPWNVTQFKELANGSLCLLINGNVGIILRVVLENQRTNILVCKGSVYDESRYDGFRNIDNFNYNIVEVRRPTLMHHYIGLNWESQFDTNSKSEVLWRGHVFPISSSYEAFIDYSEQTIKVDGKLISFKTFFKIVNRINNE